MMEILSEHVHKSNHLFACQCLEKMKRVTGKREFEKIVMEIPNLETAQILIKKIYRMGD